MPLDIGQLILIMSLNLILQLRQQLILGHGIKYGPHFKGLPLLNKLHLVKRLITLILRSLLLDPTLQFLRLELLRQCTQADGEAAKGAS